MNKLRITLNEDGSVVQFAPDFKIIRGSYYDVLINIEVPHSLLVDPVTDTGDGSGATGNNVRVGGLISTANGRILQTKRYEFQYVKDFERAGISYKLYQRKMPKEFTMWETVCENEKGENGSLKLVINVVNWTLNDLEAKVEEVSASPAFYLDIYPSEYLTEEEEIESPSDFATLQSQVQDIATDFTTLKTDLYTESGEGLGDYLKTRLAEGNKIVLTQTDNQIEIAVDTLYASDINLETVDDLDADNLQTALEEISRRFDSKSVDTITGEEEGLVDNTDPNNPVILHDATKVDVTTFDEVVEGINSAISTNAEGISELNTNLASYSLISDTGAKIDLDIDTTNYVMTLALKNASGDTLSTQTIDFPLESMVVGATYKSGTLTLTLQNGTSVDIDISSIIEGLVSQTDFDDLEAQVATNTENIASNATNISTNTANITTNTADIATNKANIATNTANIATNMAEISTNASAIATETTERKSADATLQSNIASEITARTSADTTLQGNIDSETSARTSADSTLQTNIDNEASTRATADSTLQTNIDNLELASGASLALSIDNSTYIMTLKLLNSEGTVLSTGTVDLPLETMVVSASYSDGKLYLTLQNGTTLEGIDISSIISGLVSQTDFDTLSSQVSTNTTNIATNTSDIADLKTQVETNKTNIESLTAGVDLSALQTQMDTNTSDIATNATAISTETSNRESADSDLQSQITANATAISSETSNRTSADSTLQSNINSEASTRASADSTLQTNIDNLKLASGATLALSIDESTYVMTIQLKNSAGTTLSTGTVDLPLETMVVSGTYSDGKLYLTLKNGTQLDPIDISDIVSGLVSQSDLDTEISARTSADSTLQTNINSVDSSAVHITGTETITGSKNFTGTFQINGGTITYDSSTDTFTI